MQYEYACCGYATVLKRIQDLNINLNICVIVAEINTMQEVMSSKDKISVAHIYDVNMRAVGTQYF